MSTFTPASKRIPDLTKDINGKLLIAANDTQFYQPNQRLPLQQIHVEEVIKCSQDFFYFAENYCYIVSLDKGEHIIELYNFQRNMLNHIHVNRYSILMLSRQLGKSTIVALYILWNVLFNNDFSALMVSYSDDNAMEIFYDRLLTMYRLLPKFLKPTYTESNKHKLTLTNGSSILSKQVGPNVGRGNTYNIVFVDELAFYEMETWNEWYASMYPTLSSARIVKPKIIITSTPRGINQFYDLWQGALRGENLYKPFAALWTEKPWSSEEEKEKFKQDTIKNIGVQRWMQEYMNQFLSSSHSLFSADSLSKIVPKDPIKTLYEGKLKIYVDVKENHNYILVGDMSEGTGGDYTVLHLIDVTVKPFEQVAIYRCNVTPLSSLKSIITSISSYYNDALTVIEYANIGFYINNKLWFDEEFENLFYDHKHDVPGLRTTAATRPAGVTKLKEYVENGMIIIYDTDTLRECSNFLNTGSRFEGVGSHDDVVMTLVIFSYFTTLEYFEENYDVKWLNIYQSKQTDNIKKQIMGDKEDEELNDEELGEMMIYSNNDDNNVEPSFTMENLYNKGDN